MSEQGLKLIGDPAPEFTAQTTQGPINFPGDYEGKWIVLFSHPADFTPVCTTEFMAFQARKEKFDALNAQLVGLSVDQIFSHIKWLDFIKEKMEVEITFPLIADHGSIARMFGMIHESAGPTTVRAVFIIDPKGIIRAILYYPAELGRNMEEILRMIEAFQVAEKNGVAMPANWPNNDFLGKKVIIPPAKDIKTAQERLADDSIHCYDWWLCTKDL